MTPDGRDAMVRHAAEFAELGIPFIFDPGQQLHLFGPDELARFLDEATWLTVNSYEWSVFQERSGLDADEIVQRVDAAIVTRGEEGSTVLARGREAVDIPAVPALRAVDPTGCGDAYRAGLLLGLEAGRDWETTGRIASLAGAIKVAHPGCQNHRFDADELRGPLPRGVRLLLLNASTPARRTAGKAPCRGRFLQANSTKNARR